jgi:membrane fusion protein, multidrug efflux system
MRKPYFLGLVIAMLSSMAMADENLQFAQAQYEDISRYQYIEGVVEAVNQATVTAQTSGEVLEVNFDVDDYVEQGAVLVRLRNAEHQAASALAVAQLAEAEAYYKAAQSEHKRVKEVFAKQATSAANMDKVRADLEAAQARLNAARASTRQAATQQEYTVIFAPYSGVVTERHIQAGEVARPGVPIMSGMSLTHLRVVAHVSQTQINAVRAHKQALVLLGNEQGALPVEEIIIAPHAHPPSHTFKVRLNLAPDTPDLFPGMHVKVAFVLGQERILTVPVEAIAYRGEVRGVYVRGSDGKLRMRMVRLGARHDKQIEVLAGLSEGEAVALDPVQAAAVRKDLGGEQDGTR